MLAQCRLGSARPPHRVASIPIGGIAKADQSSLFVQHLGAGEEDPIATSTPVRDGANDPVPNLPGETGGQVQGDGGNRFARILGVAAGEPAGHVDQRGHHSAMQYPSSIQVLRSQLQFQHRMVFAPFNQSVADQLL